MVTIFCYNLPYSFRVDLSPPTIRKTLSKLLFTATKNSTPLQVGAIKRDTKTSANFKCI